MYKEQVNDVLLVLLLITTAFLLAASVIDAFESYDMKPPDWPAVPPAVDITKVHYPRYLYPASTSVVYRGNWTSNDMYVANDMVAHDGSLYILHTNGAFIPFVQRRTYEP